MSIEIINARSVRAIVLAASVISISACDRNGSSAAITASSMTNLFEATWTAGAYTANYEPPYCERPIKEGSKFSISLMCWREDSY